MPVAIARFSPADAAPIESLRERRLWRGAASDRGKALEIGLVNNMPDAAMAATERQFVDLLAAASGGFDVRLHLYALGEVPRSPEARAALARNYRDARHIRTTRLDALIITGAEPVARELALEPYWRSLTELIDWADSQTFSTILSCLAAHAGVQHLDGIARQPLSTKCSGIYAFKTTEPHRLIAGLETGVTTPHSRRNGLNRQALIARDYQVLACDAEIGVDIFVKQRRSLLVFLQGHPEYGSESLAREYRRDMGRFLRGEQETAPSIPANYFPLELERSLADFAARARRERRAELMSAFPDAGAAGPSEAPWRAAAIQIYGNWLGIIAERKAASLENAPIAVTRRGG